MWHYIEQTIAQQTQSPFSIKHKQSVGGGCINQAWKISDGQRHFFVKTNHAKKLAMFQAEQQGLKALQQSNSIRVPGVTGCGSDRHNSFLILEYIDFSASGSDEQLGQQLAQMHRHTADRFGFEADNTIGSTLQQNNRNPSWSDFFARERLGFQLKLTKTRGMDHKSYHRGQLLIEKLPLFFDHNPAASLLHGDLWSGNYAWDQQGRPVIFDPATYYGDREAEIAMTELFGGFSRRFYQAYQDSWPLDSGYTTRKTLYNLYHILNHCNMFGGGYCMQAANMIEQLLSEI